MAIQQSKVTKENHTEGNVLSSFFFKSASLISYAGLGALAAFGIQKLSSGAIPDAVGSIEKTIHSLSKASYTTPKKTAIAPYIEAHSEAAKVLTKPLAAAPHLSTAPTTAAPANLIWKKDGFIVDASSFKNPQAQKELLANQERLYRILDDRKKINSRPNTSIIGASVLISDLDTGNVIYSLHPRSHMSAASMVKVWVAMAVLKLREEKKFSYGTDTESSMSEMLIHSDNEETDTLIDKCCRALGAPGKVSAIEHYLKKHFPECCEQ